MQHCVVPLRTLPGAGRPIQGHSHPRRRAASHAAAAPHSSSMQQPPPSTLPAALCSHTLKPCSASKSNLSTVGNHPHYPPSNSMKPRKEVGRARMQQQLPPSCLQLSAATPSNLAQLAEAKVQNPIGTLVQTTPTIHLHLQTKQKQIWATFT